MNEIYEVHSMRILQINATFGIGSTGRIVADIHSILKKKGYRSFVAVAKSRSKDDCYIIGNKMDHKVHALLCRIGGKQGYYSKFFTHKLIEYIDGISPDIIHIHNLHNNYINLYILLEYIAEKEIPLVITLHDCWFFTGKCFHYIGIGCTKWKTGCGNCPKKMSDTPAYLYDATAKVYRDKKHLFSRIKRLYVVGASQWVANEAKESMLSEAKITYCYNGINTKVFFPKESNIRRKLGIQADDFIILCMWNKWSLERNKKQREAIIGLNDPKIKIVVLGCPENKTDKNVYYCGPVHSPEEMAEWYSIADVFVNLTWEDTLPFVNIEALACGTPVVTHKTSGASETIDSITGILVEPGNVVQLVEGINHIKANGKKKYELNCVNRAKELFNIDNAYNHYIEIYEEIINGEEKCSNTCCH